jgi:hypothetical protein
MNKRQKKEKGYKVIRTGDIPAEFNFTGDIPAEFNFTGDIDVFAHMSIENTQKFIDIIINGIYYKFTNADNLEEAAYWFDMLEQIRKN